MNFWVYARQKLRYRNIKIRVNYLPKVRIGLIEHAPSEDGEAQLKPSGFDWRSGAFLAPSVKG